MKKGEIVERIDGGWSCQRRGCTSGIAYKWNRGPVSYGDYSLDMNTRYYILAFMYMGSTNKVSIQGLGSIRECIYKCLSPFGTVPFQDVSSRLGSTEYGTRRASTDLVCLLA